MNTPTRIGIVWNPSKVEGDEIRSAWRSAAEGREHVTATWFETTEEDPGQGATDNALDAGCEIVIAAGGDGTVRAVAERLGESGSPAAELGIVPLGTGNLLARNLGVPLGNARAAFERVLSQDATPLDLGMVDVSLADGQTSTLGFVVMVGFGIDAQMISETDDDLKSQAGWLAYVESLGRATSNTEVVELSLTLDDGEPVKESAHTVLIANCGTLQGGITLLPDAEPDDGELDLLVLRADGIAAWMDTMHNMVWENGIRRLLTGRKTAVSTDSTAHLRARTIRVDLPTVLALEVDGDDIGEASSFDVRILPGALSVR